MIGKEVLIAAYGYRSQLAQLRATEFYSFTDNVPRGVRTTPYNNNNNNNNKRVQLHHLAPRLRFVIRFVFSF